MRGDHRLSGVSANARTDIFGAPGDQPSSDGIRFDQSIALPEAYGSGAPAALQAYDPQQRPLAVPGLAKQPQGQVPPQMRPAPGPSKSPGPALLSSQGGMMTMGQPVHPRPDAPGTAPVPLDWEGGVINLGQPLQPRPDAPGIAPVPLAREAPQRRSAEGSGLGSSTPGVLGAPGLGVASPPAPRTEPLSSAAGPLGASGGRAAPSAQDAIMESQVDEMRRMLFKFKVCPTPTHPVADSAIPPHADILVFGPSGSGKSSLIRTFYRALHQQSAVPYDFAQRIIVKDTAMNEGTLKYVSAVIKMRKVDHRGATSSSAIICHDTRGHIWMDEKEQRQLGIMLDGSVKDDSIVQQRNHRYARMLWEFWRKDSALFPAEILVRRNGIATKPHALLFVFDGSMDEIPNGDEETTFYKEIIQMARTKGYVYPQVVLTRIDRVEDRLARTGSSSEDPELKLRQVLDRKIEDVVTKLDVSRNSVHFIENYHSEGCYAEGRNVAVDFHALKILTQCCSHADSFVAQQLRQQRGGAEGCSVQ